jgi:hypothetical protein
MLARRESSAALAVDEDLDPGASCALPSRM